MGSEMCIRDRLRGVKKLEKVDKDKKAKIKETMIDEQNDDKESNK